MNRWMDKRMNGQMNEGRETGMRDVSPGIRAKFRWTVCQNIFKFFEHVVQV